MSKITFITTKEMIEEHINKLTDSELRAVNKACDLVGVNINKFWGSSCIRDVANARKLLSLYFVNKKYTLVKIGEILRAIPLDHTTIIYNIKCAKNHYAREDEFKNWYNELRGSKFESNWQEKAVSIKKSLIQINSN